MSESPLKSIQWIDSILIEEEKKAWPVYSETSQTIAEIHEELLQRARPLLPPEIVREILNFHTAIIGRDLVSSSTYCGHVWFGFTSFCNQWMIAFKRPKAHQTINGQLLTFKLVTIHKLTPDSKALCLEIDSTVVKCSHDDHSLHALAVLYQANRAKWEALRIFEHTGKRRRDMVELSKARRVLVDFHLGH